VIVCDGNRDLRNRVGNGSADCPPEPTDSAPVSGAFPIVFASFPLKLRACAPGHRLIRLCLRRMAKITESTERRTPRRAKRWGNVGWVQDVRSISGISGIPYPAVLSTRSILLKYSRVNRLVRVSDCALSCAIPCVSGSESEPTHSWDGPNTHRVYS
jgi:hypothetical protein